MSSRERTRGRLAREAAARAEAATRRRRQRGALVGAGVAVAVLATVAVVWIARSGGSGTPAAAPSASASAAPCAWSVVPENARAKEMRDVGTPPATGEPRTGTVTMTITTNRGVIKVLIDRAKT